jgi:calcineurin-like phosphoesterase family protein
MEANNIWITSDTHYAHKNIVRGVTNWEIDPTLEGESIVRDFDTLEEMNERMVNNINQTVDENDVLIHLGDWSFGGYDKVEEFRSMINCKRVYLIIGNHDHHIRKTFNLQRLFSGVWDYQEIKVNKGEINLVLSHYPIISWNGQHKGTYMLHGHQHLKGDKRITQRDRMDVGICGSPEFRPYHIEEIIKELNNKSNEL